MHRRRFPVGTEGLLAGPTDLSGDIAFGPVRQGALQTADMLRSIGPVEPHRLPLDEWNTLQCYM